MPPIVFLVFVPLIAVAIVAVPALSIGFEKVRIDAFLGREGTYALAWAVVAAAEIFLGALSGEPLSIPFWGFWSTVGAIGGLIVRAKKARRAKGLSL